MTLALKRSICFSSTATCLNVFSQHSTRKYHSRSQDFHEYQPQNALWNKIYLDQYSSYAVNTILSIDIPTSEGIFKQMLFFQPASFYHKYIFQASYVWYQPSIQLCFLFSRKFTLDSLVQKCSLQCLWQAKVTQLWHSLSPNTAAVVMQLIQCLHLEMG